jgi:hypothetical protein
LDYLILGLPAEFIFELAEVETEKLTGYYFPYMTIFPSYLSSKRNYKNFYLKPVILEHPDGKNNGVSISYIDKSKNDPSLNVVGLSYQNSRYMLTTKTDAFNRFSIIDSLNATMAIILGATDSGNINIVEITETRIAEGRSLASIDLRKYVAKQAGLTESAYIDNSTWHYQSFGLECNLKVFEVADLIIGDKKLLYASMFYREAVLCINEEIGSPDDYMNSENEKPLSISEAVKLEGALHGFYKVLEAIYGGVLASKQDKVLKTFESNNVDLNHVVPNFFAKQEEKAIEKVIRLRALRNERAAHGGGFENRASTYAELYDSQQLALNILKWTIEGKYGVNIHDRFNVYLLTDKQ